MINLSEHSLVVALNDIKENDETVSEGSTGTIVGVHKGFGYVVEFTAPEHVVISAAYDEVAQWTPRQ